MYDGDIASTDTGRHPKYRDYKEIMQEYIVPHSTAKYAKHARESYMVGALARFNLNSQQLHPVAQDIASLFKLKAINYNPFMNTIAQLVEFSHSIQDSIDLIDTLVDQRHKTGKTSKTRKKSRPGCRNRRSTSRDPCP